MKRFENVRLAFARFRLLERIPPQFDGGALIAVVENNRLIFAVLMGAHLTRLLSMRKSMGSVLKFTNKSNFTILLPFQQ